MISHPTIVRATVVQAAPIAFNREQTVEKVCALTSDAARQGAKLVVFPEAFISAYPRGLGFGMVVGSRTPEGREAYRRYWESAVDVPGPTVATLSEITAQNQVYLVIGVIERDGGTLYCTVLFFAPDGRYLGKHRKHCPLPPNALDGGYGDGSTLPVFETEIGRLDAVICWENLLAAVAHGDVCQRHSTLLCSYSRWARHLDGHYAAYRAGKTRTAASPAISFARRSDYPEKYPSHLATN